jgi:ferredoxin-NADP reductase/predicted pyridoxine 5'-phosphate oxidase superfamily flavin-nucleotide-binding protein
MAADAKIVYELPEAPWHRGEIEIQSSVGVMEKMHDVGRRFIRSRLIEQHQKFYPQLPFLVVGAVDRHGHPWATFLTGYPGFLKASDEHTLGISTKFDQSDPAFEGAHEGAPIGVLGIELHTRRRNRLNGNIRRHTETGFDLQVIHSYGNCPRYIQYRDHHFERDPTVAFEPVVETLDGLDDEARALIGLADTFFVASYAEVGRDRQVDVSHRGGKPGFVRVGADGVFTIPDFNGNFFFNTLGNFALNGRAGLTFLDAYSGDVLQLSGRAKVLLESPEIAAFQGAERLWTFRPERIVRRRGALPIRWNTRDGGESPFSTMTGDWSQVGERLKAAELAKAWRPFKVDRVVDESSVIRSIYLSASDGAGLIPHKAGQHLPIRVLLTDDEDPVIKTYTLSTAPSDAGYRISVKKEGRVSQHLHQLDVGSLIEVRAPAGGFTIDPLEERPAVLLAAGVGITPMLAMLRHIVYEGRRKQKMRKTWMIYSARSKAEQGFSEELADLVSQSDGAVSLIRVLSSQQEAVKEIDYDEIGRINIALLKKVLPFGDFDFYLCGPAAFMQDTYDGLRSLSVADKRIFAESFGPASILRRPDIGSLAAEGALPSANDVPVVFTESGKQALWRPESGTLLELAEAEGLSPDYSCRGGTCGTCATRIVKGKVAYKTLPQAAVGDEEVLICSAYPAQTDLVDDGPLELAL